MSAKEAERTLEGSQKYAAKVVHEIIANYCDKLGKPTLAKRFRDTAAVKYVPAYAFQIGEYKLHLALRVADADDAIEINGPESVSAEAQRNIMQTIDVLLRMSIIVFISLRESRKELWNAMTRAAGHSLELEPNKKIMGNLQLCKEDGTPIEGDGFSIIVGHWYQAPNGELLRPREPSARQLEAEEKAADKHKSRQLETEHKPPQN